METNLDCPDCLFNKKGNCYEYKLNGSIPCEDIGCEYKICDPYTYPKKEG